MPGRPALVLLVGATEPAERLAATERLLGRRFELLTPQILRPGRDGARRFSLRGAADCVVDAITDAGLPTAVVCGIGLGAMVGMTVARDEPDLVRGLVLATAAVRLSPILMSVQAVALRLVPAATLERWGADPAQVVALLAAVRPVDFLPLAAQVRHRSLVVCGGRDQVNSRPSRLLADTLSAGTLSVVPGAADGWLLETPERLDSLLVDFCRDLP